MPLLDLAAVPTKLLQLVVETAADENVALPERQLITAAVSGDEPWDCEQVVVGMVTMNPAAGQPLLLTRTKAGQTAVPELQLRVEIVRRAPLPTEAYDQVLPPAVEDETAAGLQVFTDAAFLHEVRNRIVSQAALTDGKPGTATVGLISASGAAGGYVGVGFTIGVSTFTLVP